ncbi:MAG: hypothetical protein Q8P07_03325 [bacterium]|nr:hypothetical protein [bacterium]
MTENMLEEAKKNFENKLKTKFDFLQQHTKDDLLIECVKSIRNAFVGNGKEVLPRMDSIPNQSGTDGNC